jgi:hypothetical protein
MQNANLRPNTGMERKIHNGGGKKPNPWHTAFFQAVKQELFEYRKDRPGDSHQNFIAYRNCKVRYL